MTRFCPRCAHYFNPPPAALPRACLACGLAIRLHAVTGRVVALGSVAAMLLAAAPADAATREPIRDYPTWMRYAACVNGPNGIGRPGHSERYCRRDVARWRNGYDVMMHNTNGPPKHVCWPLWRCDGSTRNHRR